MESGPTPHLEGVRGDYASTVLYLGIQKERGYS